MRYTVKSDYIDSFYGNSQDFEIEKKQASGWTERELEQLARGWGVELPEVMEMVEEI